MSSTPEALANPALDEVRDAFRALHAGRVISVESMLEGLCGLPVNDTEGYRKLQVDQQSSEDSIFLIVDEHVGGRLCGVDYFERISLRVESNSFAVIFAKQHGFAVTQV
jgi:hypothetical protein